MSKNELIAALESCVRFFAPQTHAPTPDAYGTAGSLFNVGLAKGRAEVLEWLRPIIAKAKEG